MAVIIQNVSRHDDLTGVNAYVLKINDRPITAFSHVRSEGLAQCLRRAAEAADKAERRGKAQPEATPETDATAWLGGIRAGLAAIRANAADIEETARRLLDLARAQTDAAADLERRIHAGGENG